MNLALRELAKHILRRLGLIAAPKPPINQIDWLKERGCKIGERLKLIGNAKIDENHCWHIEIGDDVTIAPGAYILAHDASTKTAIGYTRIAGVSIGDRVFIGAHTIVLPGVSIGSDCVVGAGSVVSRSIKSGSLVVGNPAKVIGTSADYFQKRQTEMSLGEKFEKEFTSEANLTEEMKQTLKEAASNRAAYVR